MNLDVSVLGAVLLVYVVVVVSPGPNFALVTRLALAETRSTSAGAIVGLAVAASVYAIAAMSGLSVLITQVGWLARFVQLAGGGYLVYLGVNLWRSKRASGNHQEFETKHRDRDFRSGFRLGLVVNLSNPKAIAFFIGLYGVAIPPSTSLATRGVILAAGFALEIVWYSIVTYALSRRRLRATYQRHARTLDRVIGTLLMVFGIRLATDR